MEPIRPSVCRNARRNTARRVSAVRIARGEYQGCRPRVARGSYQMPHLVTALAQTRWVMEARRLGVLISLFQASQQASTMAS